MKKLAVFMLCALLTLPINVHATESQEQKEVAVTVEPTEMKTTELTQVTAAVVTEEPAATPTKAPTIVPTKEDAPEEMPESVAVNSHIIIGGKEYETSIANAGENCEIAVPLVNLGNTGVTNVVITPELSGDVNSWPFEITKTDYSKTCEKLDGLDSGKNTLERKHTFRWTLKTRPDAVSGYTKLIFNVSYNEADGSKGSTSLEYYVQVKGVEEKGQEPEGENVKTSTPRVIVTGFTTTPEEIFAGDTFKLTLNLKNTSKTTAVSNMLFDIQGAQEGSDAGTTYAAFLPTAGSSTIYVESIAPNSSKSITIELKSRADLSQKPYVVNVEMEYEDNNANAYTETASVSVPIKQEAKVDIGSMSIMPDSAQIGDEVNVMFSIFNVGKTKLYNVNVKFEADSVTGGEVFLGNLDSGSTGNVDTYLLAENATMDDGLVKILIQYEDEEGKVSVIEETMELYVFEPVYEDFTDDFMIEEMPVEEEESSIWGIVGIVAALAAVAVVGIVVLKKKSKAKKQEQELQELLDEDENL